MGKRYGPDNPRFKIGDVIVFGEDNPTWHEELSDTCYMIVGYITDYDGNFAYKLFPQHKSWCGIKECGEETNSSYAVSCAKVIASV